MVRKLFVASVKILLILFFEKKAVVIWEPGQMEFDDSGRDMQLWCTYVRPKIFSAKFAVLKRAVQQKIA